MPQPGPMTTARKAFTWFVRLFVASFALGVALLAIDGVGRPTNCGGNSAALGACSYLARSVQFVRDERLSTEPLSLASVRIALGDADLNVRVTTSWIASATFLVRNPELPLPTPPSEPVIIAVCSRSYSNVPEPTIWNLYSTRPSHAVGYSDGSWGLITPEEYAALDLASFVALEAWVPQPLSGM